MMVVIIVLAAFTVMALAAIAGTGKFGQWKPPVNDRPKGRMPEGIVDAATLPEVRIPTAMFGYDRKQVDEFLTLVTSGVIVADPVEFTVRQHGYDMQFVDELIERATKAQEIPPASLETSASDDRMDASSVEE